MQKSVRANIGGAIFVDRSFHMKALKLGVHYGSCVFRGGAFKLSLLQQLYSATNAFRKDAQIIN